MTSVPLERSFALIPDAYQREDLPLDEAWPVFERGSRKNWPSLLEEYRVVILAEAGAGKTFELKSAAERLVAEGKPAFFIRIEDIDETFGTAFEVGTEALFAAWLKGSGEAWFFLDSVDEIRLAESRAFEAALRAFASRIESARQRAHIYISSRPYAWRKSLDRSLIEQLLPFEPKLKEKTGEPDEESGSPIVEEPAASLSIGLSVDGEAAEPPPLVSLYMLAPLDRDDIRLFASHSGVGNVDAFVDALERGALLTLAQRPFDLRDLIASWRADGRLGSRLAVLQRGVRLQLERAAGASPRLDVDRALGAVRLLAMAAILTGLSSIQLPGTVRLAIDAAILLPGWSDAEISALLRTGVFGEPVYGEVRFRHREVRELLAAEWAAERISCHANGRAQLDMLIFRSQYGLDILAPRMRPLLPWLILFDAVSRDRTLVDYPEVAIEGGDASQLPLGVREALLATLIEHVVTPGWGVRGPDNAAIARIAQRDLEPAVFALIQRYRDNDNAIFVLARLVWQGELAGCVAPLMDIAANPKRGTYTRMVCVRAVATIGSAAQLGDLWGKVNGGLAGIPRQMLSEFASHAPADAENIDLLLNSIERLEPREQFEVTGLGQALIAFVDRLPLEPDGELVLRLARGFQEFLAREPHVERGECFVSKDYRWLIGPALRCVERLIGARSPAALSDASLAILAAVPALRFWHGEDFDFRKSAVDDLIPAWPELNDALFWWTVDQRRKALAPKGEAVVDDWAFTMPDHFTRFDAGSFPRSLVWIRERTLGDDRLVALSRSVRTYFENDRPAAWLDALRAAVAGDSALEAALSAKLDPTPSPALVEHRRYEGQRRRERDEREIEAARDRDRFVAELRANPDLVRHPRGPKPGQLANSQYHLLRLVEGQGLRTSRAEGANWRSLIAEFGLEVASAYRDAALAHWRVFKPGLRSERADTSKIQYSLIFAMAGLDIELGEEEGAGPLSLRDARRALRYVPWELNGFPRWFEALYRTRPKAGRAFIWKEVEWELANSPADHPLHYVLHDLVYYAPWLQPEIGPLLYAWLEQHHARNQDALRYCRAILHGAAIPAHRIATLARGKLADPSTPAEQLPIWFAEWADTEPAPAIAEILRLLDSGEIDEPEHFGEAFILGLVGGRHESGQFAGAFRSPTFLKQLYILMHLVVRVSDDIDRVGKGAYSVTLRDDAQDARERLFGMLAEIPGELSYQAIVELITEHPEPSYRDYMRARAYVHAVADGDLSDWSTEEVAALADRLTASPGPSAGEGGGSAIS